ncbi:glutamyl-tRNA reductase [Velocimicrobium porci]|uniref:Glutamyl-tRNA reductase n=1 Tax=Velocimicrobium porci TaxID=2606634 RepID=A0A6L5XUM0_9FIRM|nr:glutamyl-tRNA reductase [Velocimicrobium porci]MSS62496.1 glutamyl-tRNA reductase [Velocimicrobium porci]
MGIKMLGIDHNKANVDERALFSFTKKNCAKAMERIKKEEGIFGCIILSTCNRMEVWVSCDAGWSGSIYELLCEIKEVKKEDYVDLFVEREEKEAIWHLLRLSCGLKSKILGEDQILTQVKDALSLSREYYCTDNVLEVLFRMAVTAAKRVKTEITLSTANQSVIHQALKNLEEKNYFVQGKNCMVIGNGEMGKLTALALKEAGAFVTVTVRQYRSGIVEIPEGCERIDYGRRMELFQKCDMVVSATASPNYTLTKQAIEEMELKHPMILIDLAVPRDIEPAIGELKQIELYDIDSFKIDRMNEALQKNISCAEAILNEQMEEFLSWYEGRDIIAKVQDIRQKAVNDLELRMTKIIRKTSMEQIEQNQLKESMDNAMGKVIVKMLFGLRDTVSEETFRECVEGLEQVYLDKQNKNGEYYGIR